jgi:hypothetical protein
MLYCELVHDCPSTHWPSAIVGQATEQASSENVSTGAGVIQLRQRHGNQRSRQNSACVHGPDCVTRLIVLSAENPRSQQLTTTFLAARYLNVGRAWITSSIAA